MTNSTAIHRPFLSRLKEYADLRTFRSNIPGTIDSIGNDVKSSSNDVESQSSNDNENDPSTTISKQEIFYVMLQCLLVITLMNMLA